MQKRIVIVHRWDGSPTADWYPWIRKMLAERDLEVLIPEMPNPETPRISEWVPYLSNAVKEVNENTYFIGHSVGCQTIMRYLETLDNGIKAGGAVFVAGWFNLTESSLESDEVKKIAAEWTGAPINLKLVREHLDRSVALFSDNDPYVPLSDSKIFEGELGSKIIIHLKRGHFTSYDGVLELHAALNEILRMAK